MTSLRIGELARLANVNVQTLRFYERKGLLSAPPRRLSGYREYPPETVGIVRFIQRAQELGFSLREVKELLALQKVPRATCGDVVVLARHKMDEIDAKISDLRAMRTALASLLKDCTGTAPIAQCPILESLAGKVKRRPPLPEVGQAFQPDGFCQPGKADPPGPGKEQSDGNCCNR
ncbi:MAG: heavy metal-responsive transcriptional regulator [Planctomycetes bacterium]|nr:heavy metal-responsive transcriptional regulator [Planctomycetota bacterium]